jgi:hypothetical protein
MDKGYECKPEEDKDNTGAPFSYSTNRIHFVGGVVGSSYGKVSG